MGNPVLRALSWDGPETRLEIELRTIGAEDFIPPLPGQQKKLDSWPERRPFSFEDVPQETNLTSAQDTVAGLGLLRAPGIPARIGGQAVEARQRPSVKGREVSEDAARHRRGGTGDSVDEVRDFAAGNPIRSSIPKLRQDVPVEYTLHLAKLPEVGLRGLVSWPQRPNRLACRLSLRRTGKRGHGVRAELDVRQQRPRLLPRGGEREPLRVAAERDVPPLPGNPLAQDEALTAADADPEAQSWDSGVGIFHLSAEGWFQTLKLCVCEPDCGLGRHATYLLRKPECSQCSATLGSKPGEIPWDVAVNDNT